MRKRGAIEMNQMVMIILIIIALLVFLWVAFYFLGAIRDGGDGILFAIG